MQPFHNILWNIQLVPGTGEGWALTPSLAQLWLVAGRNAGAARAEILPYLATRSARGCPSCTPCWSWLFSCSHGRQKPRLRLRAALSRAEVTAGPLAQARMEASGVGDVGSTGGASSSGELTHQSPARNSSEPAHSGQDAGREVQSSINLSGSKDSPTQWHPNLVLLLLPESIRPKRAIPTPSPERRVNRRGFPSHRESCRNACN